MSTKPPRLKRNLSLLHRRSDGTIDGADSYLIGTRRHNFAIDCDKGEAGNLEKLLLQQLARGGNPYAVSPNSHDASDHLSGGSESCEKRISEAIGALIESLKANGLTSPQQRFLSLPQRSSGELFSRDIATQMIIQRSTPELSDCEWRGFDSDGGATTLQARGQSRILISGRSRVANALFQHLIGSGVGAVDPFDHLDRPEIKASDIGFLNISSGDLGKNIYHHIAALRSDIALFPAHPTYSPQEIESELPPIYQRPALIIHCGDLDFDDHVDWMVASQPHLVISHPLGSEITISPLVLPGKSPCLRCMELYERDHFTFSGAGRIPLTQVGESSYLMSNFIAAVVASITLEFIDTVNCNPEKALHSSGVGEITYIDSLTLRTPEVVAVDRHPLCGCTHFSSELASN